MASGGYLRHPRRGALLDLRVSPGAKSTGVEGPCGEDALKTRIAAPPTDGRANSEIFRSLARLPDAPGSAVGTGRGTSGREETVLSRGVLEIEEARRVLGAGG